MPKLYCVEHGDELAPYCIKCLVDDKDSHRGQRTKPKTTVHSKCSGGES